MFTNRRRMVVLKRIPNFVIMLSLVLGLALIPASASAQPASRAASPAVDKVSPEGFLNPDGTLRLDRKSSGQLNLSGWDVQLDPQRGPLFAPPPVPLASLTLGHWDDVGLTSVNSQVRAIAVSGSNVYVGGYFTDLNGISAADYIAKWDGASWSALGGNGVGNGSLNGPVLDVAVSGSDVYAAGIFANVDPAGAVIPEADFIARFDGSDWSALGSNGTGDGSLNNTVYAMAVNGSSVYAGGGFTDVDPVTGAAIPEADYIAKFDGTDWSALGGDGVGNGSLNSTVLAIAVSGSNVYAGGFFTNVDPVTGAAIPEADYIAKFDGSDWSALGSNGELTPDGSLNSVVWDVAISGSNVYAGGSFTDVDPVTGAAIPEADYIAKFDGTDWSALGGNGTGDGSLNNAVFAIGVSGSNVYAGGSFTDVDPVTGAAIPEADKIAKFNGTDWSALGGDGAGNGSLNDVVYAIGADAYKVYVGGNFTDVNNNGTVLSAADYAAAFVLQIISTFLSQGSNDGWVLESSEASGLGGSNDSLATTIRVGDNAADKQYRGILSFNTASLPDTAVITKVTLKVRKQGITGTDPFTTHGGLIAAIRKPYFGAAVTLANSDFQAALSKQVGFNGVPVSNWYSTNNNPVIWPYVNLTGTTQFRLRFTLDDNDDLSADYLRFYSGDTGRAYRPQLIVEYYVP